VTALYEIVPVGVGSESGRTEVDPLKYRGQEEVGSWRSGVVKQSWLMRSSQASC